MADDAKSPERSRPLWRSVEIPGGGTLADYSGLSEIIVTKSAVALAISVQPGHGGRVRPGARRGAAGRRGGRGRAAR